MGTRAAPSVPPAPAARRPGAIRTPADAAGLGTVLGVWAHPDDETYLAGALMALARRAGNRVVCATATRGEHGTDDPARWPPERLARTRDLEVAAAMAVLGVDEHRCPGFEDGTLADVPADEGARWVLDLIAEAVPDTIVSFGPDGITGHPDHRAVAAWTAAAWRTVCADPRRRHHVPRLLHATTTARYADEFAQENAALGIFPPGLPVRTPDDRVAVSVQVDEELSDVKLAALRAQATQVGPVLAALGEDRYRAWWAEEAFTETAPAPLLSPTCHLERWPSQVEGASLLRR